MASSYSDIDLRQTVCVILAGGKGKRMASPTMPKACFPVAGVPSIVRAIDTYKEAGLQRFLVVVGEMAERVMRTVATAHPEVTFAYQAERRGTGHAAGVAVEALAGQGYAGDVVVAMGDSVTRADVVRRLLRLFRDSDVEAVITAVLRSPGSTSGRVVRDETRAVVGIVELPDITLARRLGNMLHVGEKAFDPARLEAESDCVNVSIYEFHFAALREALGFLGQDNAQSELYLTDTIEYLARRGLVEMLLVSEPDGVMAFNTPEELRHIEEVIDHRR